MASKKRSTRECSRAELLQRVLFFIAFTPQGFMNNVLENTENTCPCPCRPSSLQKRSSGLGHRCEVGVPTAPRESAQQESGPQIHHHGRLAMPLECAPFSAVAPWPRQRCACGVPAVCLRRPPERQLLITPRALDQLSIKCQ